MSARKAQALYESFREAKPTREARMVVPTPKRLVAMGHCDGIDYVTTHGRKTVRYHHDFAPGCRPLLCCSPNGRQLFLLGGRFKWDARGIVDKDARGRDIIPKGHARNPRRRNVRDPEHRRLLAQLKAHFEKDERALAAFLADLPAFLRPQAE